MKPSERTEQQRALKPPGLHYWVSLAVLCLLLGLLNLVLIELFGGKATILISTIGGVAAFLLTGLKVGYENRYRSVHERAYSGRGLRLLCGVCGVALLLLLVLNWVGVLAGMVKVAVLDSEGSPVPFATVTIEERSHQLDKNGEGEFVVRPVLRRRWQTYVSIAGNSRGGRASPSVFDQRQVVLRVMALKPAAAVSYMELDGLTAHLLLEGANVGKLAPVFATSPLIVRNEAYLAAIEFYRSLASNVARGEIGVWQSRNAPLSLSNSASQWMSMRAFMQDQPRSVQQRLMRTNAHNDLEVRVFEPSSVIPWPDLDAHAQLSRGSMPLAMAADYANSWLAEKSEAPCGSAVRTGVPGIGLPVFYRDLPSFDPAAYLRKLEDYFMWMRSQRKPDLPDYKLLEHASGLAMLKQLRGFGELPRGLMRGEVTAPAHGGYELLLVLPRVKLLIALISNTSGRAIRLEGALMRKLHVPGFTPETEGRRRMDATPATIARLLPGDVVEAGGRIVVPLGLSLEKPAQDLELWTSTDRSKEIAASIAKAAPERRIAIIDTCHQSLFSIAARDLPPHSPRRADPGQYLFGPQLRLQSLSIDGVTQEVHQYDRSFTVMASGDSKGSCPYLFAAGDDRKMWSLGEVLVGAVGTHRSVSEVRELPAGTRWAMISERQDEVTYLQRIDLRYVGPRGSIRVVSVFDKDTAGGPKILANQQDFRFAVAEANAGERVEILVDGYYIPLLNIAAPTR